MADFKLSSPRLRVYRGQLEAPEVLEVQTVNPDLIAWDMTRAKHHWPKTDEAPFKWLTFIAWHAARRTGAITTEDTYEAWELSTLMVENIDDDEDSGGDGPADPTHREAEPG